MNVTITESKFIKGLHKYLNVSFKGFDDCYHDWADFNCGMGICCDPYAIGFILPTVRQDNYLFKFVDSKYYDDDGDYPKDSTNNGLPEVCYEMPDLKEGRFDVIVISEDMYERLNDLFNNINVWRKPLLSLINAEWGINAKNLTYTEDQNSWL